jgi:filamentous hemagglutinin family protein
MRSDRIMKHIDITTSVLPNCLGLFLVSCYSANQVVAQIIPDNTLGKGNSIVTSIDPNTQIIHGGASRGTNLFHSFQKFKIPLNSTVDFQPNADIKTIFSRVTGTDPSIILGTLKVTGSANLFLLNPKGIVFGNGAQLDTQGTFVATTANTIKFPNNTRFSTINPQVAPLLTIETPTPISLEFVGGSPGTIINSGNLATRNNISLIGGTVVNTGNINTSLGNGDINLITVRSSVNSVVKVDGNGIFIPAITISPVTSTKVSGLSLEKLVREAEVYGANTGLFTDNQNRVVVSGFDTSIQPGDIFIGNPNQTISVVTGMNGSLLLNSSQNINSINSDIFSNYNQSLTDNFNLRADGSINLENTRIYTINSLGNIKVEANDINLTNGSLVFKQNSENTKTGDINLIAQKSISLFNNSEVSNYNYGGEAGDVNLQAGENIGLTNAKIQTGIFGNHSGNVTLNSPQIELSYSFINSYSGLSGSQKNVTLEFDSLSLDNGSRIDTIIDAQGAIALNAANINLKPRSNVDNTISLKNFSHITSRTDDLQNNGGDINIETGNLEVYGGSSISSERQGNVRIDAKESVLVSGFFNEDNPSKLAVNSYNISDVDFLKSGNLSITTDRLKLENGGQINTEVSANSSQGNLQGGDIEIKANSLDLNRGEIKANVIGKGNSGDVNISFRNPKTQHYINLENSSNISSILSEGGEGSLGKIFLETGDLHLSDRSFISSKIEKESTANQRGAIAIAVTNLDLNNSEIATSTSGNGNAANIEIKNSSRVNLENGSTISTTVNAGAIGEGGEIEIYGTNINLNESKITTITSGIGDTGSIDLKASNNINLANQSWVSTAVNSEGEGKGGEINISATNLNVTGSSQITTTTEGTKEIDENGDNINLDAGNINLSVRDRIVLDGEGSGLFAKTAKGSDGNGGSIFIDPKFFVIQNGAGVFVDSKGQGKAGNIQIFAGNLTLNRGKISAETLSNGGNIEIAARNINLNRGIISTANFGNGGNINISANNLILNPGTISTETLAFSGGDINLDIAQLFFIGTSSQISATSGNVEIRYTKIDAIPQLEVFPEIPVNLEIIQGCQRRGDRKQAAFFNLGRSGLPSHPYELFTQEFTPVWTRWSDSNQNSYVLKKTTLPELNTLQATLPCQQADL